MRSAFPTTALIWLILNVSDLSATENRVRVQFLEPSGYADAKRDFIGPGQDAVLSEIAASFEAAAERYLPPTQSLEIQVLDLNRAGAFEPALAPTGDKVRVQRGAYWPSLRFRYVLKSGDTILESDEATLADLDHFVVPHHENGQDPLAAEKRLIERWFKTRFGESRPTPP